MTQLLWKMVWQLHIYAAHDPIKSIPKNLPKSTDCTGPQRDWYKNIHISFTYDSLKWGIIQMSVNRETNKFGLIV